jgi:hypothetical protein
MHEIQEVCGKLEEFRLVFTAREANELARLCAKQCNTSRRRWLWINYIPTFLTDCVRKECNPGHHYLINKALDSQKKKGGRKWLVTVKYDMEQCCTVRGPWGNGVRIYILHGASVVMGICSMAQAAGDDRNRGTERSYWTFAVMRAVAQKKLTLQRWDHNTVLSIEWSIFFLSSCSSLCNLTFASMATSSKTSSYHHRLDHHHLIRSGGDFLICCFFQASCSEKFLPLPSLAASDSSYRCHARRTTSPNQRLLQRRMPWTSCSSCRRSASFPT